MSSAREEGRDEAATAAADYQAFLFHLAQLEEETKRLAANSQRLVTLNEELHLITSQSQSALRNLLDEPRAPAY